MPREEMRHMIMYDQFSRAQGLFGVTAVGDVGDGRDGFDDDDEGGDGDGDDDDDDELSDKVRNDAAAGASGAPQQMAVTLDEHGNIRKDISTCSPE